MPPHLMRTVHETNLEPIGGGMLENCRQVISWSKDQQGRIPKNETPNLRRETHFD